MNILKGKDMGIKLKLYILCALLLSVVNTYAQSLSVQDIEAQTGKETQLVVSLAEGTSMTALQFNLSLPEGVSLKDNSDTYGTTLGEATDGHTLSVQPLASGDLLVILYSMELKAFSDGELLRIPLQAGDAANIANGKLYTVRTTTVDAVSHPCADATFSAKVTGSDGIEEMGAENAVNPTIHDLQGRRIKGAPQKGIYIKGSKKVLIQ